MNEKAGRATQTELRNYLHELRAMPPPTPPTLNLASVGQHTIAALTMAILVVQFASESDFNDFPVAPVARCPRKELVNHYR